MTGVLGFAAFDMRESTLSAAGKRANMLAVSRKLLGVLVDLQHWLAAIAGVSPTAQLVSVSISRLAI